MINDASNFNINSNSAIIIIWYRVSWINGILDYDFQLHQPNINFILFINISNVNLWFQLLILFLQFPNILLIKFNDVLLFFQLFFHLQVVWICVMHSSLWLFLFSYIFVNFNLSLMCYLFIYVTWPIKFHPIIIIVCNHLEFLWFSHLFVLI